VRGECGEILNRIDRINRMLGLNLPVLINDKLSSITLPLPTRFDFILRVLGVLCV
jgi:hypothetical protein